MRVAQHAAQAQVADENDARSRLCKSIIFIDHTLAAKYDNDIASLLAFTLALMLDVDDVFKRAQLDSDAELDDLRVQADWLVVYTSEDRPAPASGEEDGGAAIRPSEPLGTYSVTIGIEELSASNLLGLFARTYWTREHCAGVLLTDRELSDADVAGRSYLGAACSNSNVSGSCHMMGWRIGRIFVLSMRRMEGKLDEMFVVFIDYFFLRSFHLISRPCPACFADGG